MVEAQAIFTEYLTHIGPTDQQCPDTNGTEGSIPNTSSWHTCHLTIDPFLTESQLATYHQVLE